MKVIKKNSDELLTNGTTSGDAIQTPTTFIKHLIVNEIVDRVVAMTLDLTPTTERDARLNGTIRRRSSRNLSDKFVEETLLLNNDNDLRCSLPLEKIDDHILHDISSSSAASTSSSSDSVSEAVPAVKLHKKRLLCLFCDRIFVSANLRQKHVERCHSANQLRRSSSRTPGHNKLAPSCMYCGQIDTIGNDLKKLFEHLIVEHSAKYHGCLNCEERFTNKDGLKLHNETMHIDQIISPPSVMISKKKRVKDVPAAAAVPPPQPPPVPIIEDFEETIVANVISAAELLKQKELMEKENEARLAELERQKNQRGTKKSSAKTKSQSRTGDASSRLRARKQKNKVISTPAPIDEIEPISKDVATKPETENTTETVGETPSISYEFDENFFSCVAFNIQDNLLNHLDGKLHSNIDDRSTDTDSVITTNIKNVCAKPNQFNTNSTDRCNLALTAITPVTTLLTSQIGIDAYRQIEYGSKAPKQINRKHYVKYNFRSRKQKTNDAETQKDIAKLDMWTQVAMKMRQQKVKNANCVSDSERQVEELNRILDTRGPFQDLHEEALHSQKQQQQQQHHNDQVDTKSTDDVKTVLEDILVNVFDKLPQQEVCDSDRIKTKPKIEDDSVCNRVTRSQRCRNEKPVNLAEDIDSLANYFNLSRTPTRQLKNDVPAKNESMYKLGLDLKRVEQFLSTTDHDVIVSSTVELSGEWARPRIYICGACGVKITNLKLLEDHKTFIHPHVWCVHYEFVGNQSEYYPHLNIPGLGRIMENEKMSDDGGGNTSSTNNELWEKSVARVCSKCAKECNTLSDLHRHMLECGGDWSWMLAKKKCKYRPFGARSRRRRILELKRKLRVRLEGVGSSSVEGTRGEHRRNRSKLEGPRPPRPSDAETIQRMLANLPPKRATRKIMCLKEAGLRKPRINPNNTPTGANTTISNTNTATAITKNTQRKNKDSVKIKQALQRNLRSRNQLKRQTRSATNSPKQQQSQHPQQSSRPRQTKQKVQKVLASKIIDSNTAAGPKSKLFGRRKTHFGETIVTRLRNKLLLAQKYMNHQETNGVRLTRSRGLQKSKIDSDDKPVASPPSPSPARRRRRIKSLQFDRNVTTSPLRRSNRMRILTRLQRLTRRKQIAPVEDGVIKNVEALPECVDINLDTKKPQDNIDVCIESVVANITGEVTYKEYPMKSNLPFNTIVLDTTSEKVCLGKRKRVISTQTDKDEIPPTKIDTISQTIEEVIAKYCLDDDLFGKWKKTKFVSSSTSPQSKLENKCDPKCLSQTNFPIPLLEAVGPPDYKNVVNMGVGGGGGVLQSPDNIVTIPILLPVVSHVIISSGTQLNSNLLEQIMDTSINNFPPAQPPPPPPSLKPDHNDYHNYVSSPIQKLFQNHLYTSGAQSQPEPIKVPQITKNKTKTLKKPIKKLNDCIDMLKQKLLSKSPPPQPERCRTEILKIPTPKFPKTFSNDNNSTANLHPIDLTQVQTTPQDLSIRKSRINHELIIPTAPRPKNSLSPYFSDHLIQPQKDPDLDVFKSLLSPPSRPTVTLTVPKFSSRKLLEPSTNCLAFSAVEISRSSDNDKSLAAQPTEKITSNKIYTSCDFNTKTIGGHKEIIPFSIENIISTETKKVLPNGDRSQDTVKAPKNTEIIVHESIPSNESAISNTIVEKLLTAQDTEKTIKVNQSVNKTELNLVNEANQDKNESEVSIAPIEELNKDQKSVEELIETTHIELIVNSKKSGENDPKIVEKSVKKGRKPIKSIKKFENLINIDSYCTDTFEKSIKSVKIDINQETSKFVENSVNSNKEIVLKETEVLEIQNISKDMVDLSKTTKQLVIIPKSVEIVGKSIRRCRKSTKSIAKIENLIFNSVEQSNKIEKNVEELVKCTETIINDSSEADSNKNDSNQVDTINASIEIVEETVNSIRNVRKTAKSEEIIDNKSETIGVKVDDKTGETLEGNINNTSETLEEKVDNTSETLEGKYDNISEILKGKVDNTSETIHDSVQNPTEKLTDSVIIVEDDKLIEESLKTVRNDDSINSVNELMKFDTKSDKIKDNSIQELNDSVEKSLKVIRKGRKPTKKIESVIEESNNLIETEENVMKVVAEFDKIDENFINDQELNDSADEVVKIVRRGRKSIKKIENIEDSNITTETVEELTESVQDVDKINENSIKVQEFNGSAEKSKIVRRGRKSIKKIENIIEESNVIVNTAEALTKSTIIVPEGDVIHENVQEFNDPIEKCAKIVRKGRKSIRKVENIEELNNFVSVVVKEGDNCEKIVSELNDSIEKFPKIVRRGRKPNKKIVDDTNNSIEIIESDTNVPEIEKIKENQVKTSLELNNVQKSPKVVKRGRKSIKKMENSIGETTNSIEIVEISKEVVPEAEQLNPELNDSIEKLSKTVRKCRKSIKTIDNLIEKPIDLVKTIEECTNNIDEFNILTDSDKIVSEFVKKTRSSKIMLKVQESLNCVETIEKSIQTTLQNLDQTTAEIIEPKSTEEDTNTVEGVKKSLRTDEAENNVEIVIEPVQNIGESLTLLSQTKPVRKRRRRRRKNTGFVTPRRKPVKKKSIEKRVENVCQDEDIPLIKLIDVKTTAETVTPLEVATLSTPVLKSRKKIKRVFKKTKRKLLTRRYPKVNTPLLVQEPVLIINNNVEDLVKIDEKANNNSSYVLIDKMDFKDQFPTITGHSQRRNQRMLSLDGSSMRNPLFSNSLDTKSSSTENLYTKKSLKSPRCVSRHNRCRSVDGTKTTHNKLDLKSSSKRAIISDSEDELPLAKIVTKTVDNAVTNFEFKQPEPVKLKRRVIPPVVPLSSIPGDETTDDESDVPLAKRFGLLNKKIDHLIVDELDRRVGDIQNIKKPEENLEKITITFKKVSKLNSTIGLQLTDFENVQIITKPKTADEFKFKKPECRRPIVAKPQPVAALGDETDEERSMPLIKRLEMLKQQEFKFKTPAVPGAVKKRAIIDETTDEESDIPLAQRFKLKPPPGDETDGETSLPLAERVKLANLKQAAEETDGETSLPLAERLNKLVAEETDDECYIPLAQRIGEFKTPEVPTKKRKLSQSLVDESDLPSSTVNINCSIEEKVKTKRRQTPEDVVPTKMINKAATLMQRKYKIRKKRRKLKFTANRRRKVLSTIIVDEGGSDEHYSPLLLRIKTNFKPKTSVLGVANTENYCDICKKYFCRAENLIKHKMTFTHIAKLSELEAKQKKPMENDEDNDDDDVFNEETSNFDVGDRDLDELALKFIAHKNRVMDDDSVENSDNDDRVEEEDIPFELGNGVNYPDLVTSNQPPKRYRSLGERKSFDSNQSIVSAEDDFRNELIMDGEIVEDDCSLYNIDKPVASNATTTINEPATTGTIFNYLKKSTDTSPPIKHDSFEFLAQNLDENFTRKKLNRDEELFLECCSLLKNNSTSRKPVVNEQDEQQQQQQIVHHQIDSVGNTRNALDDDDWSNNSNSIASDWLSNRANVVPAVAAAAGNAVAPSGGESIASFNTILMNNTTSWINNNTTTESLFKAVTEEKSNFECISLQKEADRVAAVAAEAAAAAATETEANVHKNFDHLSEISSLLSSSTSSSSSSSSDSGLRDNSSLTSDDSLSKDSVSRSSSSDFGTSKQDDSTVDSKKIPTKGALKIFEGIKVSIPTHELNLAAVLSATQLKAVTTSTTPDTAQDESNIITNTNGDDTVTAVVVENKFTLKPSKIKLTGNKLGLRECKKKFTKPEKKIQPVAKATPRTKDVYDFEDSQDELDVNFKSFRDQNLLLTESKPSSDSVLDTVLLPPPVPQQINSDSESDHHDYIDSFSVVDDSSHSSTDTLSKKATAINMKLLKNENKKGMIMGRIFKHAVKPKSPERAPDVDTLFDSLLEQTPDVMSSTQYVDSTKEIENAENTVPKITNKKVVKKSSSKRIKSTSDDEFCVEQKSKKVNRRRKLESNESGVNTTGGSGINLEQEIRECIGVAGRKSQRKCTSGKQNILVEFWSSDDEELLGNKDVLKEKVNSQENVIELDETEQVDETEPKRRLLKNGRKRKTARAKVSRKCSKIRNKTKARGRQRSKKNIESPKESVAVTRRKRSASEKLYYWSSSSDDEFEDYIEVKPLRSDDPPEDDRPMQHGWIVGDSPKKLVTMLAQAKGKKVVDGVYVKEQGGGSKRSRVTSAL